MPSHYKTKRGNKSKRNKSKRNKSKRNKRSGGGKKNDMEKYQRIQAAIARQKKDLKFLKKTAADSKPTARYLNNSNNNINNNNITGYYQTLRMIRNTKGSIELLKIQADRLKQQINNSKNNKNNTNLSKQNLRSLIKNNYF